jgi:hypothetical protein
MITPIFLLLLLLVVLMVVVRVRVGDGVGFPIMGVSMSSIALTYALVRKWLWV